MNRLAIVALLALVSSACTSVRHAPATVKVAATSSPVSLPPAVTVPPAHPEAVYHNPKIGVVYLRAHEDADGRLFGPQLVYQITDPGGWNVDALDQSGAYIPVTNLEVPADAASPSLAPARQAPPIPPDAPMLDPAKSDKIVITGLMRKENQAQAEAMARRDGEGRVAVFDSEAGWLLMPVTTPAARPSP